MLSLILIACHMVGDYVVQTDAMAAAKLTDPKVRAVHVATYSICFLPAVAYAGAGFWAGFVFLLLNFVAHFITDSRRWASGEKWAPKPILVDQTIHAVTLAILGSAFLER